VFAGLAINTRRRQTAHKALCRNCFPSPRRDILKYGDGVKKAIIWAYDGITKSEEREERERREMRRRKEGKEKEEGRRR
jgi:hypothetical protein